MVTKKCESRFFIGQRLLLNKLGSNYKKKENILT